MNTGKTTKKEHKLIAHLNDCIEKLRGSKNRVEFWRDCFGDFEFKQLKGMTTILNKEKGIELKIATPNVKLIENYYKKKAFDMLKRYRFSNMERSWKEKKVEILNEMAVLIIYEMRKGRETEKRIKETIKEGEKVMAEKK